MNLLRKIRDRLRQSSEPAWDPIRLSDSGFISGANTVEWALVTKIAAFKKDRSTFDDVWFEFASGTTEVRVCEEQPGFKALLTEVEARFPSVSGWERCVIPPAFAENYTVLYVRP